VDCIHAFLLHKLCSSVVHYLQEELEKSKKAAEELEKTHETELENRNKQLYQLKSLMAHFKKVTEYTLLVYKEHLVHLYRSFLTSGPPLFKLVIQMR